MNSSNSAELTFYAGAYANYKSEGIYICSMDQDSGAIRLKGVVKGIINPSFIVIDHKNRFLYSVNEISEDEGGGGGFVSAFRINKKKDTLELMNKQPSRGSAPCHLVIDKNDCFVLVSNYASGNVAVLPVLKNGSLGPPVEIVQHEGSSINPDRQQVPHAHSAILDASNNYALVADLGIDKVMIYKFDCKSGKLSPADKPFIKVAPGAGPRHIVFHPGGMKAYLISELNSTLTVFNYDAKAGNLNEIQTISTLPSDYSGENTCADLHISHSGRHVYASNRGHDSIAVFSVDKSNGELSLIQHQSSLGKTPRNFAIDPDGRFLVVANQNSDSIVVFRIDSRSGKLSPTGHELKIPSPACLKFKSPNTE
jgi:6-phosphogluconolactonase